MISEFSKPAFELKNKGDISEVIESPYGFHIIKKIDSRPVPSFEEMKKELESRIKQDPERSQTSKEVFVSKLKKEYNFIENQANLDKLMPKNIGDSTVSAQDVLFVLDGNNYKTEKYIVWLNKQGFTEGTFNMHYPLWVVAEITAYEDSRLEQKYPDFRYLLQEYHDGILLFNISEEKIWNYAAQDSVGLEKFYQSAKKYNWEERFKGAVITCTSDSVRAEADKYFTAGLSVEEIKDLLSKNEPLVQITEGAWEKGANPIVDYYEWNGAEPQGFDSSLTFVQGEKIAPEPKLLDEARGLYISDYQKYIEENWIKELRAKYKVVVNKKLLKTITGV
jgi:peptidyl-prolyl cis-trans isomerase SurA